MKSGNGFILLTGSRYTIFNVLYTVYTRIRTFKYTNAPASYTQTDFP